MITEDTQRDILLDLVSALWDHYQTTHRTSADGAVKDFRSNVQGLIDDLVDRAVDHVDPPDSLRRS